MDATSLNSPFCGMGYQPPRDKYKMIVWERHSTGTQNALCRRELLATMKSELTDITDEADLNDYLERVRDDYYEDKKLRQQWNGKTFAEDRSIYLDSLRKRNFDEEAIRRKMFMCFDAEKKIIPCLYKKVNGQKLCINKREADQSKRSFDSLWRKKRIEALNELTLTTAQWAEIYDLAKCIRKRARRIRGGFKPTVPRQYENIRQMILAADSSSISRLKTEIMTSSNIPQEFKLEFSEMILLWSQRLYQKRSNKE